jgi:glycolate oxidase
MDLIAELRNALEPRRVLVHQIERVMYSRDASTIEPAFPQVICLVHSTEEVQSCVRIAQRHHRPVTTRGSGTGLAGGSVPLNDAVVIVTTKMNNLLAVDAENQRAIVEPGALNLDLTRWVTAAGLHYAPDPSSQQSCSIGGNVATNAGGPHCLNAGVTSAHVLGVEVVLATGEVVMLGGPCPDPDGLDLRGSFIGSEGTMGVATRVIVRLMKNAPKVITQLAAFSTIREASEAVTQIIAAGILPAALEMMDANCIKAVEQYAHAGLPTDAGAVLLIEVDGLPDGTLQESVMIEQVCTLAGATSVRTAHTTDERLLLWKARKSAFGAIANIKPNYYLHDAVVPRTRLAEVMEGVVTIADSHELIVLNVFHAGDGNLHPLLVFDKREPGITERVHAAGAAIIELCLSVGGALSGEHGIGLEKRDYMTLMFSDAELEFQGQLRAAFDPTNQCNPEKVLPTGSVCGELSNGHSGDFSVSQFPVAHAAAGGAWI